MNLGIGHVERGTSCVGDGSVNSLVNVYAKFKDWLTQPHYLLAMQQAGIPSTARILDVGCGNHSPSRVRALFPDCRYEGVDRENWNRDQRDADCMDRYFPLDLDVVDLTGVLDREAYDVVLCSHVLEHLRDPGRVVADLGASVRPGGWMYVETPSSRSLNLPSAQKGWFGFRGCLNFRDDDTHRDVVDLPTIRNRFIEAGWSVNGPRIARSLRRIVGLPVLALGCLLVKGFMPASILWDVTGFAECLEARKNRVSGD